MTPHKLDSLKYLLDQADFKEHMETYKPKKRATSRQVVISTIDAVICAGLITGGASLAWSILLVFVVLPLNWLTTRTISKDMPMDAFAYFSIGIGLVFVSFSLFCLTLEIMKALKEKRRFPYDTDPT